jgi:hypothetical protein
MRDAFAQTMISCLIALVMLAVTWCGLAGAQRAEEPRVLVVVGAAAVSGSNVTAARQAAISNGLMEAVALTAFEMLPPEKFVENFKIINSKLLEPAEDYIQDFKVLSEAASGKHHRVVLQATVMTKKVSDLLSEAVSLPARPTADSAFIALSVEGSGNLSNFVKFRRSLGGLSGVESIQLKEMKPNETTLLVAYRGTSEDLAAALAQQPYDAFGVKVIETADRNSLRVAIVPK